MLTVGGNSDDEINVYCTPLEQKNLDEIARPLLGQEKHGN